MKAYLQAWKNREPLPAVFGAERSRTLANLCTLLRSIEPTEDERILNAFGLTQWRVGAYDYGKTYIKEYYNTEVIK